MRSASSKEVHDGWPLVNVAVGEVGLKAIQRLGPANGRRLNAWQIQYIGNPCDEQVQIRT